jgi:hypothetical protein
MPPAPPPNITINAPPGSQAEQSRGGPDGRDTIINIVNEAMMKGRMDKSMTRFGGRPVLNRR